MLAALTGAAARKLRAFVNCLRQVIDLVSGKDVTTPVIPIVLSGGGGTRLWPLSQPSRPKQLWPLVSTRTLLQETLGRLAALRPPGAPPIIVCNERHSAQVAAQVRDVGVTPHALVLEPVGRNSAPAVTVAALLARASAAPATLLLVLPADHVIQDAEAFAAAVLAAMTPAAAGHLVTFGIVPTAPATGYGYIRRGQEHGSWANVAQFVEKPDRETARGYLESGRYLWNSGMFLFSVGAWLREMELHAPALLSACERAVAEVALEDGVLRLGAEFRNCESISVDYAVMEKTTRAAVVPLVAGWSDIGSWSALHDVLAKDSDGNVVSGDALLVGCRDTYVVAHRRTVAAVGLDGVIVVETPDAVLVVARDHAERVKVVAEKIAARTSVATDVKA
jgi:mannose-1-phosphate guanylyltransferase/mannose-6-phosphate isomerase